MANKAFIVGIVVVGILTLLQTSSGLSGEVCAKSQVGYEKRSTLRVTAYARRTTKKCGFLWFWRCSERKRAYKHVTQYKRETIYSKKYECCTGWSLDKHGNCNIHNKYPIVSNCPSSSSVKATGTTKVVTWNAPEFKEPYDKGLSKWSSHTGYTATLPWGTTTITYTATSLNNNKQSSCTFTITVNPPDDKPMIQQSRGRSGEPYIFKDGDTVELDHELPARFTCRADNGNPVSKLWWFKGGTNITSSASYRVENVGRLSLKNAISEITLKLSLADHTTELECRAIKTDNYRWRITSQKSIKIIIDVHDQARPVIKSCPENIVKFTVDRTLRVPFTEPVFEDLKNEPLTISKPQGLNRDTEWSWGEHSIVYKAENKRNDKTATCSFSIKVSPNPCDNLPATPFNGAMVCGTWSAQHAHLCQPTCHVSYDLAWGTEAQDLFICGANGEWFPDGPNYNINCTVKREAPSVLRQLPSDDHYYTGTCSRDNTHIKNNFCKVVSRSLFADLINCKQSDADITCGKLIPVN